MKTMSPILVPIPTRVFPPRRSTFADLEMIPEDSLWTDAWWGLLRVIVLIGSFVLLWAATLAHAQSQDIEAGAGSDSTSVATVRSGFEVGKGDRNGKLFVTVDIKAGYHIYAMTQPKPFIATEIHVDESNQFELSEGFTASHPPKVHVHESIDVVLYEHEGRITWTAPLELAPGVDPQTLKISGHLYAQACNDAGCLPPRRYPFKAQIESGASRLADSNETTEPRLDFGKLEVEGGAAANAPLGWVLLTAFVAGFLLNFMPCVLPVIGLKVMGFAHQAGERRGRVFLLNLWYSLGLMSVFGVLATLAVFLGLSWGEQFSSVTFNTILASVVFVFALSFLGVWQIPIPGFVGSGKAAKLAEKEGAAGAFSKGILATILATPCSGPMLGAALTWAVSQPPAIAYVGFASVGLGMASPYLLIGVFPKLIAFLPKPGAWMETFERIMGFVLLATVVYLLTFITIAYVLPVLALLVGLGAACWWIGRTPLTEPFRMRFRAWASAGVFATLIGFVSFGWLHGVMESRFQRAVDREIAQRYSKEAWADSNGSVQEVRHTTDGDHEGNELPWQPYSRQLLEKLTAASKTVFVDFTADWCLTCQANEAVALNVAKTKKFVESNGIVTLKADKTQPSPEADELLELLGNKGGSIPFYAIFPAGNPNQPILLDGLFTSPKPILEALKKAGPSKGGFRRAATIVASWR